MTDVLRIWTASKKNKSTGELYCGSLYCATLGSFSSSTI